MDEQTTIVEAPQIGNRTGGTGSLPKPKSPRGGGSLPIVPTPEPVHTEPAATTVTEKAPQAPSPEPAAAPQAQPAVTATTAQPTTVTPSPEPKPEPAPAATVVHDIDPNAQYKLRNGRVVSGKTLLWEEGLLNKTSKAMNQVHNKEQNLQEIINTAVQTAVSAMQPKAATEHVTAPVPVPAIAFTEPEPQAPQGAYEDSPEMKAYEKQRAGWEGRKLAFEAAQTAIRPFVEQQQQQFQQAQQQQLRQQTYQHNLELVDALPQYVLEATGVDIMQLPPEQRNEAMYRLERQAEAQGVQIRLTQPKMIVQDIAALGEKLHPLAVRNIALEAFIDGWRPDAPQQATPQLSPEAQAVADRIQQRQPLVEKVEPPPPLIPPASDSPVPDAPVTTVAAGRRNKNEKYAKFLGEAK